MKISTLKIFSGALLFILLVGVTGADSTSPEKTKTCFVCKGTGEIKCPNCKNGEVDCSGPCLKLSRGKWVHMQVAGHSPTDLWQSFPDLNDNYVQSWNQNHVGDVIQYQNGKAVDIGKCKICGGTGKVECPVCHGTMKIICPMCAGKKVVPESWTTFDNPKMKNRPSHFKLKDGRELIGRKIMVVDDDATIRTETGEVEIKTSDIVSEEKPH